MKVLNVPLCVNTCPHLAIHIGTIAPLLAMTIVIHLGVMKKPLTRRVMRVPLPVGLEKPPP
ncbi:hypothetical protein A2U01_0115811, partial [Trifolium medium]|nr:hypothetical protein [Trifolium medium]